MCKTGKVVHFEVGSDDKDTHLEVVESDVFLGILTTPSKTIYKKSMGSYITLINGKPVLFKIDTGVDVSVIPEAVFKQSQ